MFRRNCHKFCTQKCLKNSDFKGFCKLFIAHGTLQFGYNIFHYLKTIIFKFYIKISEFIRHDHHRTPLNVSHMTEKQWYQFLLESKVIMVDNEESNQLTPCRAEMKNPELDWESTWPRARLPGLGSEIMSFLFKVVHDLLPTQERIARTSAGVSGDCKFCVPDVKEDLLHALVRCQGNQGIGHAVLHCLPLQAGLQDLHVLKFS